MSRSYRQPFGSVCGKVSAKYDKRFASRGARRKQNQYLKNNWASEDFLLPHRLECSHNEVYSWSRDGKQYYQAPDARDWFRYLQTINGDTFPWYQKYYSTWTPLWYNELIRK